MEKILATTLAVGGTIVSFLFGQWHIALSILLALIVMDIITGVLKGYTEGNLKSSIGFKGFARKGLIMAVVILAHWLDVLTGDGQPVFRTMAVYFYIALEGLSILENASALGLPVPAFIKDKLGQVKESGQQNNNDSNM